MSGVTRKGFSKALKGLYDWLDGTNADLKGASGAGAPPAVTGLTVQEQGVGAIRKTVFTFVNVACALTDVAGVVAYVGKQIYDWPAGYILFHGAVMDLALTKSSAGVNADWDGDVGLGTVTASNNSTLASTEQDLVPTTATPQAVAGVTTADGQSTSTEALKILDGHTAAKDIFLNLLVDDADQDVTTTPCNLIVNGTIEVTWSNLGDN